MLGLMQDWPLLCHKVIDHAAVQHPHREVLSRSVEGPMHRTTYADIRARSLRLAKRLQREGIAPGDRVATMAWNTWRHLECWYGVLGCGAVYHTLNPRLFPEQIAWIMRDAEDRLLFVDATFAPIVAAIAPIVPSLERTVVLCAAADMPEGLPNALPYEEWLAEADDDFRWLPDDERQAAGMCYTSGTTGDPKGVVYSHRSNVLHAMAAAMPDFLSLSSRDRLMPVVPFFHANGWSTAFSGPMTGAGLVLPGPGMDGASIHEMLDAGRVTITAAVPTVWAGLLDHLRGSGEGLPHLQRVVIGGSACPRSMAEAFERDYDVRVLHAWGMTEMSPLGSFASPKPETDGLDRDAWLDVQETQGHPPFTVELKVTDDDDRPLPWDGRTFGRLRARGAAVASGYYRGRGAECFDAEGWFDTGDVAHIDPNGYMRITDRAKDVVKSGGEWISTIELENLASAHPDVAEAAAIGVPDDRWGERPLLIVVAREGATPSAADVLGAIEGRVARWWVPDRVEFVDAIPHTATGKIRKTALRERFGSTAAPPGAASARAASAGAASPDVAPPGVASPGTDG